MLDLTLPTERDWAFVGMPEDRIRVLEEQFDFADLVSEIGNEAVVEATGYEDCNDRPGGEGSGHGSRRWNWRVQISPPSLDRLFNSRFGLRAYYWVSPHAGWFASRSVLLALKDKAQAACPVESSDVATISYIGVSAKLWPDEGDRSFEPRYLRVARWEGKKPHYAWAPNHGILNVKGAFVFEQSGRDEHVPAIKRTRESDIHSTGFA